MKGRPLLMAIVMGVLVPSFIFSVAEKIVQRKDKTSLETTETNTIMSETNPTISNQIWVQVLHADGSVVSMELENYLVGVLLGEIPGEFHTEAFKAQAVVARTYTLKRSTTGQKHPSGAVCTDPACCQAYCTVERYLSKGGSQSSVNKAKDSVITTAGQVLTYNGALIEATYFSCSGGRTEDALAVWGNDIPYLQAVDSPGEEKATYYTDTVKFRSREFADRLGINPKGLPATWFGQVTYTDGGGVDTMVIAGHKFKGTELRQKLGLRSTVFSVAAVGDTVSFSTKGFGHRVGMSQYGAEAMAVTGSAYGDILAHYYPGTSLHLYSRN